MRQVKTINSFNKYSLRSYQVPSPGPATGDPGVFKAQPLTFLPLYPLFRKITVKYMRKALAHVSLHVPFSCTWPFNCIISLSVASSKAYNQSYRGWEIPGERKCGCRAGSDSWRHYEWVKFTMSCPPHPNSAPVDSCLGLSFMESIHLILGLPLFCLMQGKWGRLEAKQRGHQNQDYHPTRIAEHMLGKDLAENSTASAVPAGMNFSNAISRTSRKCSSPLSCSSSCLNCSSLLLLLLLLLFFLPLSFSLLLFFLVLFFFFLYF